MRVLIPIKNLQDAKQRLSSLLTPYERKTLFKMMLEDLLCVLSVNPDVSGITLVSDDPYASVIGLRYKADILPERKLRSGGLSDTVQKAVRHLTQQGIEDVMVIHGDLPLVSQREVSHLIHQYYQENGPAVTLSPDRHRLGTNVVLCHANSGFTFNYGKNSLLLHSTQELKEKTTLRVVEQPGTGCDIDYPDDLEHLLSVSDSYSAPFTHQFLFEQNIPARLFKAKNGTCVRQWVSPATYDKEAGYAI